VFSMEPLALPLDEESCEMNGDDTGDGVTGLNCAGFGSSMVVTATFGMVAAGHVLRKLAEADKPADVSICSAAVQTPDALLS